MGSEKITESNHKHEGCRQKHYQQTRTRQGPATGTEKHQTGQGSVSIMAHQVTHHPPPKLLRAMRASPTLHLEAPTTALAKTLTLASMHVVVPMTSSLLTSLSKIVRSRVLSLICQTL